MMRTFMMAGGFIINLMMSFVGFLVVAFLNEFVIPRPNGDYKEFEEWIRASRQWAWYGAYVAIVVFAILYWPWWNRRFPTTIRSRTSKNLEEPLSTAWPIVRILNSGLVASQLLRLGKESLSFSHTFQGLLTDEKLSEDVVQAEGSGWAHFRYERIRAIRMQPFGLAIWSSLWSRFEIETAAIREVFVLRDEDCPNVMKALSSQVGYRFQVAPVRRWVDREVVLWLIGAMAVVFLLVGISDPRALFVAIPVLATLAIAYFTYSRRKGESPTTSGPAKRRLRVPGTGRTAFQSPLLGWLMKLIGLASMVAVFFFVAPSLPIQEVIRRVVDPFGVPFQWQLYATGLLYLPGIIFMYLGYVLCQRTFAPHRHPDPRAPILYLRAFDDDSRLTMQPTGWLAKFHGISQPYSATRLPFWIVHPTKILKKVFNADLFYAEELLAPAFRRCGPFVAIGRPGERMPTPGADRMYVPDDRWQEVVLDWIGRSQAVVLQPARTDGVRWEIEQVLARGPRHRLLLSLINFHRQPDSYEDFRAWFARDFGIELPLSLPFRDSPSFAYFESDGTLRIQQVCYRSPLVWSFVGSAVDSSRTFHTFIQGLHGGARDLPLPPKKHVGHGLLSMVLLAGLAIGFVYLVGWFKYQGLVATEIARNEIRSVVEPNRAAERKTYGGRAIPYEFQLDADWKPTNEFDQKPNLEYAFSLADGIGKLTVAAKAGKTLSDWESDNLLEDLRGQVEIDLRKSIPAATVKVQGSRWVNVNSVQWREVTLEQRYGYTASEMKRVLIHSASSGWVGVTIILPNLNHYKTVADEIVANFKVPGNELDQILDEARKGEPVIYKGKKATYRLNLRPIWKREDLDKQLENMGERGKKLKEMNTTEREYIFRLGEGRVGEGKFADLEVEVLDDPIDFAALKDQSDLGVRALQEVMESAAPGFTIRITPDEPERLMIDGREWGELRSRLVMSKGDYIFTFRIIQRLTNHIGKGLAFSASLHRDHPNVDTLVREVLDSIRFDD